MQTISIVDDHFLPDEAREVIETLIDDRLRLHKIQMLRQWERNHRFDSKPFDDRIRDMKVRGLETRALISQAKSLGLSIEVKASIEVKLIPQEATN